MDSETIGLNRIASYEHLRIHVAEEFMFNRIIKIRSAGLVFMRHLPRLEIALVPITTLNLYLHSIPCQSE